MEATLLIVVPREGSGSDAEVILNGSEDLIPAGTCLFHVPGLQGESQAFRRGIRLVDGDMAPPHAAVVPEVMIGVVVVDSQCDFGLSFHNNCVL